MNIGNIYLIKNLCRTMRDNQLFEILTAKKYSYFTDIDDPETFVQTDENEYVRIEVLNENTFVATYFVGLDKYKETVYVDRETLEIYTR